MHVCVQRSSPAPSPALLLLLTGCNQAWRDELGVHISPEEYCACVLFCASNRAHLTVPCRPSCCWYPCTQEDEATLTLVQRHLLRGTATEALDALLSWSELEFGEDDVATATAAGEPGAASSSSWTPATRSKLVKSLPAEVGQPLAKAVEASGGVDPQVCMLVSARGCRRACGGLWKACMP